MRVLQIIKVIRFDRPITDIRDINTISIIRRIIMVTQKIIFFLSLYPAGVKNFIIINCDNAKDQIIL
jgi:hypothetical protein